MGVFFKKKAKKKAGNKKTTQKAANKNVLQASEKIDTQQHKITAEDQNLPETADIVSDDNTVSSDVKE